MEGIAVDAQTYILFPGAGNGDLQIKGVGLFIDISTELSGDVLSFL
jgi:hypothetical protein